MRGLPFYKAFDKMFLEYMYSKIYIVIKGIVERLNVHLEITCRKLRLLVIVVCKLSNISQKI